MRICFFRTGSSIYPSTNSILYQVGLPQSSSTYLSEHQKNYSLTGNRGNMVHRMGIIQSLACERSRSSQINLIRLYSHYKSLGQESAFAPSIKKNFDAVVLTLSNSIRKGSSDGAMLDAIKSLDTDIIVVGLGLQRNLHNGLSELTPAMKELLLLLNEKAKLFGVRGHHTLKWLKNNGLHNAIAIGCPSMFAYPKNIAKIRSPLNPKSFLVAGHIGKTYLASQDSRALGLMRQFSNTKSAYVFQDELETYEELMNVKGIYDEATGSVDAKVINQYIKSQSGADSPFSEYYSFNDVSAWRQMAKNYDVYIGDRIHGGVVAMQAGVPALILYADVRVAELAEYHGIPACPVNTFLRNGLAACLERYISDEAVAQFQKRYIITLKKYATKLKSVGLSLAHQEDVEDVIAGKLS